MVLGKINRFQLIDDRINVGNVVFKGTSSLYQVLFYKDARCNNEDKAM